MSAAENKKVTLILPIRDEGPTIRAALDAVLAQNYPAGQMEILIADGMSTDGTREIVREYQRKHANIKLLDNPGRIVPTGMNTALRQAAGDIIIRVDGHCVIAPDYVENCLRHLANDTVDGVGGPMKTIGLTPLAETIALAMSARFGVGNSAFRTTQGQTKYVDTIPFPAYKREVIQKAGLYDEELVRNQDDEYNYRIRELGGKLLLAGDVRSVYYSRGSMRGLWKQYYQYGFYKVRVLQKHPQQMSARQFIPLIFILSIVGSLALALFRNVGWVLLASILGAYLFAAILSSFRIYIKKGWGNFLILPIAFITMHISYGLGFAVGLIAFWKRWGDKRGAVPSFTIE